jgi:bacterioferritin
MPVAQQISTIFRRDILPEKISADGLKNVSHAELIDLLNQDLLREYQTIIAYVVYSQALKGAESLNTVGELEKYVIRELNHAMILGEQIDFLTSMLLDDSDSLGTSKKAIEMLQSELGKEAEIIRNYSERIRQCDNLSEHTISRQIRAIQIDKQIHQTALAVALSKNSYNQLQVA